MTCDWREKGKGRGRLKGEGEESSVWRNIYIRFKAEAEWQSTQYIFIT